MLLMKLCILTYFIYQTVCCVDGLPVLTIPSSFRLGACRVYLVYLDIINLDLILASADQLADRVDERSSSLLPSSLLSSPLHFFPSSSLYTTFALLSESSCLLFSHLVT
ncbi:hypothetical protein GGR50DRAFT_662579 [Xylaria sp. CBS 124048]|nr:hypothetical protein GGR50DRAFT_662579 [Xylaria sp. CBS 124048]